MRVLFGLWIWHACKIWEKMGNCNGRAQMSAAQGRRLVGDGHQLCERLAQPAVCERRGDTAELQMAVWEGGAGTGALIRPSRDYVGSNWD